jgi:hypothetical protein
LDGRGRGKGVRRGTTNALRQRPEGIGHAGAGGDEGGLARRVWRGTTPAPQKRGAHSPDRHVPIATQADNVAGQKRKGGGRRGRGRQCGHQCYRHRGAPPVSGARAKTGERGGGWAVCGRPACALPPGSER